MIITGVAAILALFAILLCKPPKPVEQASLASGEVDEDRR